MTGGWAPAPARTRVSFTVAGLPAPQGSKRAFVNRHTGKPVVLEMGGQKLKDWRWVVQDSALRAMHVYPDPVETVDGELIMLANLRKPLTGPLAVSLKFVLPKPKSAPKNRLSWPDKRPDLDKLVRSTLDGLTGPVFADDAQVVSLMASKNYPAEPSFGTGVDVVVWQVGED